MSRYYRKNSLPNHLILDGLKGRDTLQATSLLILIFIITYDRNRSQVKTRLGHK